MKLDQKDKIGSMVKALNEMKQSVRSMIESIGFQVESLTRVAPACFWKIFCKNRALSVCDWI